MPTSFSQPLAAELTKTRANISSPAALLPIFAVSPKWFFTNIFTDRDQSFDRFLAASALHAISSPWVKYICDCSA